MRYLRKYELKKYKIGEEPDIKKYWLIPTDERFVTALININCDELFIQRQSKNKNIFLQDYIYVSYESKLTRKNPEVGYNGWGWSSGFPEFGKTYEEEGYKYMGAVNIEGYELNIDKYNL